MSRRRNPIQKGIKDYIVPIIGLLLMIILIFNVFSGGDKKTQNIDLENKIGLSVSLSGPNSEGYIVYPGDYKNKIEGDISLYKGEKVIGRNGNISLSLAGVGDFNLNKIGELKYLENGDFALYSGDLWINSESELNLNMKFAEVQIGDNTNIAFSQNEVGSTIYLINGFATVSNLVGESTVLASGQKILITKVDASKKDLDLSLKKTNIDDYYKQSDWFIINNGEKYLMQNKNNNEEEDDIENSDNKKKKNINSSKLISFSNLSDESNVSSEVISISGNYSDKEITKITLNGTEAKINKEEQTFIFEKVLVNNRENDLIFKVYDDANDLLSKFVYVVFYEGANISKKGVSKFKVQTFDVDGSQFTFTTIKDGVSKKLNGKTTYTTYGNFLTLFGKVTAGGIANVSVNGYTLKSFNGSTWRYHPSTANNNLSNGTNVYEIKYFDENGTVVYTNHFTIIKKDKESEKKKIISDEAKIN